MINLHFPLKFLQDIKHNCIAGLWLFIGSRRSLEWVRPSILQLLFWGLLGGAVNTLLSWLINGEAGYFNAQGLISYALWPFLALIAGIFLSQKTNNPHLMLVPTILWLVLDTSVIALQSLIQFLVLWDYFPRFLDPYLPMTFIVLFIWQSLSIILVLARELKWAWWERILISFATLATLITWQVSVKNEQIWQVDEVPPSLSEQVFYAQPTVLNNALGSLELGNTEKTEWYFMGIAGASYQDVFKSEILRIKEQFETQFNTTGQLVLINNPSTATKFPFASKTSIEIALYELGKHMNHDDVLFLYMTSHGTEGLFELENAPISLDPIDPMWLRRTLDKAGIRWRVIIISACRSGSFIPALQSSNTLVITAAAADKDSFGCNHEADYTYFGRAFFDQSLREQSTLHAAFIQAQQTVTQWEHAQGFKPSEPQWSIGKNMETVLPQLERHLFSTNTKP